MVRPVETQGWTGDFWFLFVWHGNGRSDIFMAMDGVPMPCVGLPEAKDSMGFGWIRSLTFPFIAVNFEGPQTQVLDKPKYGAG
jgi:hypothetical protein